MRIDALIGHDALGGLLKRLIVAQRLPHAFVLEGPAGIGRRSLAHAVAQALLCSAPEHGDACGRCSSCQLMEARNHPDYVELPTDLQRSELPVAMLRDEIVAPAYESPLMGQGRVFVLPAVDRLRSEGANALLKILEEPPAQTHLCMTTCNAGALLETITSRAQIFRMQALSVDQVAHILERGGLDHNEAQHRALLSTGGHRGLWGSDIAEPPLEAMTALLSSGYDPERVAEVMDCLPSHAGEVPKDTTVNAEQRRLLGFWFEALIQYQRRDLRGPQAEQVAQRIEHLLRLRSDLRLYVQPRLIVEGLALSQN